MPIYRVQWQENQTSWGNGVAAIAQSKRLGWRLHLTAGQCQGVGVGRLRLFMLLSNLVIVPTESGVWSGTCSMPVRMRQAAGILGDGWCILHVQLSSVSSPFPFAKQPHHIRGDCM